MDDLIKTKEKPLVLVTLIEAGMGHIKLNNKIALNKCKCENKAKALKSKFHSGKASKKYADILIKLSADECV